MDNSKMIVRIGTHKVSDPIPTYDFSKFVDTEYYKTIGLVAASQYQLSEQIKSKMRLDPAAKEVRYFYYEAIDE